MDGGASASDPFRLPSRTEELLHPFGNGLVIRYGFSERLVSWTVAVAGIEAGIAPSIETPFQLIYFVVSDSVGTPMAVLRAVLKEGLKVPGRPPKALVIEKLQTVELYRNQGLATNAINFIKDLTRANGIDLFANSTLYAQRFWEQRGFQQENLLELNVFANDGDAALTILLRAGAFFTEYRLATELQPSSIERFYHCSGLPYDDTGAVPPMFNGGNGGASASAASSNGPVTDDAAAVGCIEGGKSATGVNAGGGHSCDADGGHVSPGVRFDSSPGQPDGEEEVRRLLAAANAGASLESLLLGSPSGPDSESESDEQETRPIEGLRAWTPSSDVAVADDPLQLAIGRWLSNFDVGGGGGPISSNSSAPEPPPPEPRLLAYDEKMDGESFIFGAVEPGTPEAMATAAAAAVAASPCCLSCFENSDGQLNGSGPTLGLLHETEEAQVLVQLAVELSLEQVDVCGANGQGSNSNSSSGAGAAFPSLADDTDTAAVTSSRALSRGKRQASPESDSLDGSRRRVRRKMDEGRS